MLVYCNREDRDRCILVGYDTVVVGLAVKCATVCVSMSKTIIITPNVVYSFCECLTATQGVDTLD